MNTTTDWTEALASHRTASLGAKLDGNFMHLTLDPALFGGEVVEVNTRNANFFHVGITYNGALTSATSHTMRKSAEAAAKDIKKIVAQFVALLSDPTLKIAVVGTHGEGTRPVTAWSWGPEVSRKGIRQQEFNTSVYL